jgi:hypothetical protein
MYIGRRFQKYLSKVLVLVCSTPAVPARPCVLIAEQGEVPHVQYVSESPTDHCEKHNHDEDASCQGGLIGFRVQGLGFRVQGLGFRV